jgi:CRISPR-associated protein Cmr2
MSNPSSHAYIGLAIGPIVSTLQMAESTRELWAASYTFTYLIKEIARRFDAQYPGRHWYKPALGPLARETFLPAPKRRETLQQTGAGIFPDHLIFSSEKAEDLTALQSIALQVLKDLAHQACGELNRRKKNKEPFPEVGLTPYDPALVEKYFLSHFQIHMLRKEIDASENPILAITDALSTAEMFQLLPDGHTDFLKRYWAIKSHTQLTLDAFGRTNERGNGKYIVSIPEVAISSLLKQNQELKTLVDQYIDPWYFEEDNMYDTALQQVEDPDLLMHEVMDWIKKHPEKGLNFLAGHKYVSIVHADGDGVGKFLKALPNEISKQNAFSEALGAFSLEASVLIEQVGGLPVYLGGDDALFFAPVLYQEPAGNGEKGPARNIFDLCQELDKIFKDKLSELSNDGLPAPSLSFGVSITYVKYPLYEALQRSRDLLSGPAKRGIEYSDPEICMEANDRKYSKNNIAFALLKGSGNLFGGVLQLDPSSPYSLLADFTGLLNTFQGRDGSALRSVIYDLPNNQVLYQQIAPQKEQLQNYLRNSFDEDIHQSESVQKYMDAVGNLIHKIYMDWRRYPSLRDYLKPDEKRSNQPLNGDCPEGTHKEEWTARECQIIPNRICYGLLKTLLFLTTPEEVVKNQVAHV